MGGPALLRERSAAVGESGCVRAVRQERISQGRANDQAETGPKASQAASDNSRQPWTIRTIKQGCSTLIGSPLTSRMKSPSNN
jgi:hypothetical protein